MPSQQIRRLLFATVTAVLSLAVPVLAQFEIARVSGHDVAVCNLHPTLSSAIVDLDDDTLLVGAPMDFCAYPATGSAYVFRAFGGAWVEEAKLVPAGISNATLFGSMVAIDGDWAFAGMASAGAQSGGHGAVYVFRRTGSFPFATWTPAQLLLASNAAPGDGFGVSLDFDDDTLVVGSSGQGRSAYVFRRSGGVWGEVARLDPPPGYGSYDKVRFDAGTLVARLSGGTATTIDVFESVGGAWGLVASFSPPDPAIHGSFGYGFDVSGDTLLVGAPLGGMFPPFGPGSVYRSTRVSGVWGALVRTDPNGIPIEGGFGAQIALDGSSALVSARFDQFASLPILVIYSVEATALVERGRVRFKPYDLSSPEPPTLALDDDLIVSGTTRGVAIVHSLTTPTPESYCTAQNNSAGCLPRIGFAGVPSTSSTEPFWIEVHDVPASRPGLVFFGRTGRASVPFEGGTLCVLPPLRRTEVQVSSATGATLVCPGTFQYDFNALLRTAIHPDLTPGMLVQAQLWYRDPAASTSTGLTDALEFGIGF